jgi:hypothetical protein
LWPSWAGSLIHPKSFLTNPMLNSAPIPDKSGGLNGSSQHWLEFYLQEFQRTSLFASVEFIENPVLFRSN